MKIKFLPQLDENAIRIWKKDVRAKPCLGQNKEHQKGFEKITWDIIFISWDEIFISVVLDEKTYLNVSDV